MQIVCPNCATNYQIESSALGAAGRLVRCVRCRYVWFARDPEALASIAQAHRSDVQALAASIAAAAHGDQPLGTAPYDPSPGEATPPFDDENPYPLSDEPLEIADAPTLAPTDQDTAAPAVAAPAEDLKTGIARRVMRRAGRTFGWWLPGLPVAILALLALDAALIGWRADVVRAAPQTASLYAAIGLPVNLRGLTFADVTTATETHEGVPVLVVEGTIVSASPRIVEVPRLRFSVRNRSGQEVYAWTAVPSRSVLGPGESLSFRSRLASPPPDAREVLVRFFNRRDLVAGIQ
ncbi:MAG TPA: MJ0042-type zinc finger domain-containing protein [Xanthobacteraceae bacterium]|nr:MJ0042-type zinc finger domain-containing protein [Xanthobacteraceae bacterium]